MNNKEIDLVYTEQYYDKGVNKAIVRAKFGNF
jgi:hypothetical protein